MKDLGFTETQQAIRSTIREYLEREVEPLVAEMEAERLLPYVPIRRMVAALGFGADGELTQMIKDSPPEEMLKFFVPRILSIEMSRICAGMALSHGASLGLCAGNVLSKGTPEQKERFCRPAPALREDRRLGAYRAAGGIIRDPRHADDCGP
jgi:acyl-CoA dehydrogenase